MGEVAGLILAFGLAVAGADSPNEQVKDEYMRAARQAFNGGYVQSGLKPMVDKKLKSLERRYVPKELEKYGSVTAIIIKTVVQQQLSVSWSF